MIKRKNDFLNIHPSWKKVIKDEFEKSYFIGLRKFVEDEINSAIVYPPRELIFNAFNLCHFDNIKVVILGQDPYFNSGQAQGLAFSVPDSIQRPPSLRNIFLEIESDLGIKMSAKNNLESWAKQGVLLINSALTVRESTPFSHANCGWMVFTDKVIQKISFLKSNIVFLLWGKPAQQKISFIDSSKHCVLTAAHPSPLSASRGFFGCKHFSKTNDFLISKNQKVIDWKI